MHKDSSPVSPRYQQIAIDIASKIVNGHYSIGDKVYARSALSSQYSVSPETARRAIAVLSHVGIVKTTRGSGVVINSYEKAVDFIKEHTEIQTIRDLKDDIRKSMERQSKENIYLDETLIKLLDKIEHFKAHDPFSPFEITINNSSHLLGKTIEDVEFWLHTGATIIGIKRDNKLIISPGPQAIFKDGDIFYFIGDEDSLERVRKYLYS